MIRERSVEVGDGFVPVRSGLLVPADQAPVPRPVAIDLFCGAGGFSVGFHQAGWHVAAAIEADHAAMATYLANLGSPATVVHEYLDGIWHRQTAADCCPGLAGTGWISHDPDQGPVEHVYLGDIRHMTGQRILDDLGLDAGEVSAVIGGPPCQGFSTAGRQDVMDPRNSLVFEFARLVLETQPRTFVLENVPAITRMVTADGLPVLDALALYLANGGYADYHALRRSLHFDPTARAGIRRPVRDQAAEPDEPRGVQPDLFAEAPS
jgi:DNA (cytosine-5)-methyltransferase 1